MAQGKSLKRLAGKEKPAAAQDAGPASKRQRGGPGAGGAQEDGASPEASNAVRDVGCAARADLDDAGGDAWRGALEALRKDRPQERAARKADAGPPKERSLLAAVRGAVESGTWTPVTSPAAFLRPSDISAVTRQLDADEVHALIAACARRYESHPCDRFVCSGWILPALGDGGEDATQTRAVRRKLRPLLRSLSRRVGPAGRSGEVLSCLGKWRYVAELAAVRRETMKAAEASGAGATQRRAQKAVSEEEEDSDGEDDAAEGEAQEGSGDSDE